MPTLLAFIIFVRLSWASCLYDQHWDVNIAWVLLLGFYCYLCAKVLLLLLYCVSDCGNRWDANIACVLLLFVRLFWASCLYAKHCLQVKINNVGNNSRWMLSLHVSVCDRLFVCAQHWGANIAGVLFVNLFACIDICEPVRMHWYLWSCSRALISPPPLCDVLQVTKSAQVLIL